MADAFAQGAKNAMDGMTIRGEVLRTTRLAIQALASSEWNTGHDQIEGDMESAIGDARMALNVCGNQEDGCSNQATWRYNVTVCPGLKKEQDIKLLFCDDCWQDSPGAVYQTCQACRKSIASPDRHAVMPDQLLTISRFEGGETIYKREACKGIFHDECGRVCHACCTFITNANGPLPESAIRKVAGIEETQLVCFDCRGTLKDEEFVRKNAAILEPSKSRPGLVRIKPGMRAGVRRAVREDDEAIDAAKTPAGKKRAIEAAPAPKKRGSK